MRTAPVLTTVWTWTSSWGVTAKVFVPALAIVAVTTGAIVYSTWRNTRTEAISLSVTSAERIINQYKALRGYYTKHVVEKVKAQTALRVSHDHKEKPDAIPLPATLIHDRLVN